MSLWRSPQTFYGQCWLKTILGSIVTTKVSFHNMTLKSSGAFGTEKSGKGMSCLWRSCTRCKESIVAPSIQE